ncbi:hypothetical protein ACF08M_24545 [Streptomyces sp. NPDC015032]|uniref:hypothetical protein n=1 Tax=Streptomyces sp. NPDC015032 TaxID=3364937 RepID=UPI0037031024
MTAGVGVVERHGDVGAVGADSVQRLAELVVGTEGAGVPVDVLAVEARERVRVGGGGRRSGGEHHQSRSKGRDASGS